MADTKEIQQGNKLIAEFIGRKRFTKQDSCFRSIQRDCFLLRLVFTTSKASSLYDIFRKIGYR